MKRAFLLLFILPVSLWARPKAEFEKTSFDFGVLPQGSTVSYSYPFKNVGNEPLKIESVQTTCGCTAAVSDNSLVEPGRTAQIQVTFDSRGKMGDTLKQVRVRTNDPDHPMNFLTISGRVTPSGHPEVTGPQNLFEGSCSTCHARSSEGKKGENLYMASCAMCHENHRRGGRLIASAADDLSGRPTAALRTSITDGVAGTSMPAFGHAHGGPLSSSQIKSLVRYIHSQKDAKKRKSP
ncbi:MAG: DUF1573 domain-containing protein [Elusimicrobia bacterium]|nr:DUF1573 domain-containing protein [Elusimicrobiota bacterium]